MVDFPEEVDADSGIKVYGETSYENQMAVLSHYLHNHRRELDKEEQAEIIGAICIDLKGFISLVRAKQERVPKHYLSN